MADQEQQAWSENQEASATGNQQASVTGNQAQVDQIEGPNSDAAARQQIETVQHQLADMPNSAALQALAGQNQLTAADIAAIQQAHQQQQQHNALMMQAHQAQQDYDNGRREKNAGPESMPIHSLTTGLDDAPQLQHQHDADYERERKEKRKVANREAARRMRQRRSEQVNTLSGANLELQKENATLQQQLAHLANHNRELMTENQALRQELFETKQKLGKSMGSKDGEVAGY